MGHLHSNSWVHVDRETLVRHSQSNAGLRSKCQNSKTTVLEPKGALNWHYIISSIRHRIWECRECPPNNHPIGDRTVLECKPNFPHVPVLTLGWLWSNFQVLHPGLHSSLEDLVLIIICISFDGFNTLLNAEVCLRNERLREVNLGWREVLLDLSAHGAVRCCSSKPPFVITLQCIPTINTYWSSALWLTLACAW